MSRATPERTEAFFRELTEEEFFDNGGQVVVGRQLVEVRDTQGSFYLPHRDFISGLLQYCGMPTPDP